MPEAQSYSSNSKCYLSISNLFVTDISYNVACAVFIALSYHRLLQSVVSCCPSSFTYGEAVVTTQALLLFAVASVTNMLTSSRIQTCFGVFTTILQVYRLHELTRESRGKCCGCFKSLCGYRRNKYYVYMRDVHKVSRKSKIFHIFIENHNIIIILR